MLELIETEEALQAGETPQEMLEEMPQETAMVAFHLTPSRLDSFLFRALCVFLLASLLTFLGCIASIVYLGWHIAAYGFFG